MTRITILAALALSALLAGCAVPSDQQIGSGPITLSPFMQSAFEIYLAYDYPLVFMVTADGREGGGSVCESVECKPEQKKYYIAHQKCQQRTGGKPCYIYAIGDKIVWKDAPAKPQSETGTPNLSTGLINEIFHRNPHTKAAFHNYLTGQIHGAFAMTETGSAWGRSDCLTGYCWPAKAVENALINCRVQSKGEPCKIAAIGSKIIW